MNNDNVNARRTPRTWCTLIADSKEALQRLDELGYVIDEEIRASFTDR